MNFKDILKKLNTEDDKEVIASVIAYKNGDVIVKGAPTFVLPLAFTAFETLHAKTGFDYDHILELVRKCRDIQKTDLDDEEAVKKGIVIANEIEEELGRAEMKKNLDKVFAKLKEEQGKI